MNLCNHKDCLLHPENPHNYENNTYSVTTNNDGSVAIGRDTFENNTLQIGDVALKTSNNISELIIEFKNYNIKVPIECLFCNKKKEIDMQNEVYKRRAKSLLKER